ncbi:MAG: hypothetical protein OCC45_06685 [Desulfotalea sp.]
MANNFLIATIFLSVLSLFFALWVINSNRAKSKLASQLHQSKHELQEITSQLNDIEKELTEMKDFQSSIDKAEITTKLQSSRLDTYDKGATTPEKYQYINNLTQQGMGADEVASILKISPQEAHQLVSLAKLARKVPVPA